MLECMISGMKYNIPAVVFILIHPIVVVGSIYIIVRLAQAALNKLSL